MKRLVISEKVISVVDTAAYFTGLVVLAFLTSTIITLSSLQVGYLLADVVSYTTAPAAWTPTWDYTTIPAEDKCLIPPDVQENADIPMPEVQDVKAVSTVFIKAKVPTP